MATLRHKVKRLDTAEPGFVISTFYDGPTTVKKNHITKNFSYCVSFKQYMMCQLKILMGSMKKKQTVEQFGVEGT